VLNEHISELRNVTYHVHGIPHPTRSCIQHLASV